MEDHYSPFSFRLQVEEYGGNLTQNADEEGLVDQFAALRIDQVELERQDPSFLPFLMAVLQQA